MFVQNVWDRKTSGVKMFVQNKYISFYIERGVSDNLFIRLAQKDATPLSEWLPFKDKYQEKDLKTAIKVLKSNLKNRIGLNKVLEV